ncbi:MAG TPA: hypothetical protein VEJ63_03720 [Planctomycetota bacterium]|nr:hypothetical protein [Planctomycetota bacterium]
METDSGSRYLLDFQGIDLYGAAERFDRDRAVVRGTLSYSRYSRFPVLVVDRITFHPYRGQSVTYRIRERHRDRWDRWDDGYPVRYERRYYYR